jgi:hypothetical protein
MDKLIGDPQIEPETLNTLRQRGGSWAVYQNLAWDSVGAGHITFLKFGPGCTHEIPPAHMPDTAAGCGWKYRHVGFVDLNSGRVDQERAAA